MTRRPQAASVEAELRDDGQERRAAPPARTRDDLGAGWGADARRFTRDNPAVVLVGAFALGVLLARVARHA